MKRLTGLTFTILVILLLGALLFGCNSDIHTHKWGSWYDNGDGTHMRMCLTDSEHIEYANHIFSDYEIKIEATDIIPGEKTRKCLQCGYTETEVISPTGNHIFDREIVNDIYLYSKESEYCSIYYKSCECGAYGNPNYLFEKSLLPDGYSNLEYIKGNGVQYIDTEIENDGHHSIKYNTAISGRLPNGYQEVEYIESTGTQFIELGFGFDYTDKVEFVFSQGAGESNDKYMVSPNAWNTNTNKFAMGVYYNYWTCAFGGRNTSTTHLLPFTMYDSEPHLWVYSNKVFSINDFNVTLDCGLEPFGGTTTNLRLFYGFDSPTKGKIYSYKHYKSNKLILDLVPCYKISNKEPGLFNLVNMEFYGNDGIGEFFKGSDITDALPSEYVQLEYIESDGNVYIDTNFNETNETTIDCDFYIGKAKGNYIYGGTQIKSMEYNAIYNNNVFEYNYKEINFPAAERIIMTQSLVGDNLVYNINGTIGSAKKGICDNSRMYIFACNQGDRPYGELLRCYMFKIYDDGIIKRDYIPCIRIIDGTVGMFDMVERKFYENAGDGAFIIGNILYPSINSRKEKSNLLPKNYVEVEYIESTGTQYIDTNYVISTENEKVEMCVMPINGALDRCSLIGSCHNKEFSITPYHYALNDGSDSKLWVGTSGNIALHNGKVFNNLVKYNLEYSAKNGVITETINGNSASSNYSGSIITNNSIIIFGCQYDNTVRDFGKGFRLYNLSLYDNDKLVRDYIPVLNLHTNEYGLYDLVEMKFYGNAGEGEFISQYLQEEPKIENIEGIETLLEEYVLCEYIQTFGSQYIDTGYRPQNATTIECKVVPTQGYVFGAGRDEGNGTNAFIGGYYNGNGMCIEYGATNFGYTNSSNGIYEIKTFINDNKYYLNNNGSENSAEITSFSTSGNILIGAIANGPLQQPMYYSSSKFYYFKIYNNGIRVRDFIPCVRKSDGKAGLYELVENKFYMNFGIGDIISGPCYMPSNDNTIKIGFNYDGKNVPYNYSRIYDVCIFENDELICELIPALRNSDSAIGMYDIINDKFYSSTSSVQFFNSGIIGHHLDDGEIVKEATYCEDGTKCYTCSICGAKIYEKISKCSYKVSFDADDGVKAIRIYSSQDPDDYEIGNIAYTRNIASNNYSTIGAAVLFAIEFNDGYELDSYYLNGIKTIIKNDTYYIIVSNIQNDTNIRIVTKEKK